MNRYDLKEYLGIVVDMEKHIYLQKRALSTCRAKIKTLGQPTALTEPHQPEVQTEFPFPFALMGGIVGAILFGILFRIFGGRFRDGLDPGFVIGAVLGFWSAVKENRSKIQAAQRAYDTAWSQYNTSLSRDNARVQTELRQKACLESMASQLHAELAQSQQRLEQIYSYGVIYPKYRNFVMVSSLYEYICAGRCDTLEGHEGAYNILETEIRLDHIITQLDRVIFLLNRIQDHQYLLYSAIQEANQHAAQLLESSFQIADRVQRLNQQGDNLNGKISQLQKTSALTAYCAERTRKELHYMNRMNDLNGRNAGSFFDRPPH